MLERLNPLEPCPAAGCPRSVRYDQERGVLVSRHGMLSKIWRTETMNAWEVDQWLAQACPRESYEQPVPLGPDPAQ
jgi:hypothetical protein